jgi:hypothetical protein
LYPAVPVSIITLLVDFYTAATFSTDGTVYGNAPLPHANRSAHMPFAGLFSHSLLFVRVCITAGEVRGEVAMQEPPKLWQQWRKMLADIFFFFEYCLSSRRPAALLLSIVMLTCP